jgi:hypothetical protein
MMWTGSKTPDRTRFFLSIAARSSVPLSALVFFVAICKATDLKMIVWTAEELGAEIGLGEHRIRQLLAQAKRLELLDYQRTMRGFKVCLSSQFASSKWLKPALRDPAQVGFYRLSTAQEHGYTGSVLLELLDPEPKDPLLARDLGVEAKGHITASRACQLFTWMRIRSVRRALDRLVDAGWLARTGTQFRLAKSRWGDIVPDAAHLVVATQHFVDETAGKFPQNRERLRARAQLLADAKALANQRRELLKRYDDLQEEGEEELE